jgi:general secretion pathway protein L
MLAHINEAFSDWINAVAATGANWLDRLARPRIVKLVQVGPTDFEMQLEANGRPTLERLSLNGEVPRVPSHVAAALAGSRVELVLQPELFVFRPLELPSRAGEFLHGIVRAQIDRLTPWSASAAAFGWSKPVDSGSDRIVVTIAATAQSLLQSYRDAINKVGAHSLTILTRPLEPDATAGFITVLDERARGVIEIARIRRGLVALLLTGIITASAALAAAAIVDAGLEARQAQLSQQLVQLRAGAGSAQQLVERRKRQTPAAVVLLEALSDILPDHTYVTELRIEANKVRLTGASRDAVSLIQLIERSGRFTRASFFAPTTRSSSEPTERFHIEAIIQTTTAAR